MIDREIDTMFMNVCAIKHRIRGHREPTDLEIGESGERAPESRPSTFIIQRTTFGRHIEVSFVYEKET